MLINDSTVDTRELSHGKYNCSMAVYLDHVAGMSGEDDWTGNSDLGESTLRFGKWLVSYNDQGSIEAYKYDTEGLAMVEFERIDSFFSGEEEETDTLFHTCAIHPDRNHSTGDLACEILSQENYYGTE